MKPSVLDVAQWMAPLYFATGKDAAAIVWISMMTWHMVNRRWS